MSKTVVLLFIEFIFHGYNVVSARMCERAHRAVTDVSLDLELP